MELPPVAPPGALRQADAEAYLGMGAGWLDDAPHIPWCDIRKPGAKRAVKVWLRDDLDAFLRSRRVLPGERSRFGE